jgi:hypothetical protein
MNIFEQEDLIKGLPDQALMKEAQQPSGQVPQYLVVSEIQRRQDMRKRFAQQNQEQPQGTVKDQILSGIAAMGQPDPMMQSAMGMQQPPQQMPQQPPMGMPQQMAPPQQPMPMPPQQQGPMPPQGMAAGGVVRMQTGQQTPFTPTGSTIEELAASIYDYQRPGVGSRGRPDPTAESREQVMKRLLGEDAPAYAYNPFRGPGARPKFEDFVRQSGLVDKYLPQEEEVVVETEQTAAGDTSGFVGGSNAIDADASKTDLPTSTTATEKLIKVASNTSGPSDNVQQDLTKLSGSVTEPEDTTYQSIISGIQELQTKYADLGTAPDFGEARAALQRMEGLGDKFPKADYTQLLSQLQKPEGMTNFSDLAPNYESMVTEVENRVKKIKEDADKEVGAQALIQLGAGLAEGNVARGLRDAGKAVSDIRKQARSESKAETQLADRMKMASKEAQMNLGVRGKVAAIDDFNRRSDLLLRQFESDRARELEMMGLEGRALAQTVALETQAAKATHAATVAEREAALNNLVKQAAVLRYQDLEKQSQRSLNKAILGVIDEPIQELLIEFIRTTEDPTPEMIKEKLDQLLEGYLTLESASVGVEDPDPGPTPPPPPPAGGDEEAYGGIRVMPDQVAQI